MQEQRTASAGDAGPSIPGKGERRAQRGGVRQDGIAVPPSAGVHDWLPSSS